MRMPFQIDLIGKVVLITGVSSGIGLGTAHEFARAGACVAGCARKPESDDSVSAFLQAVEGEGCKALYVQADVTQEEELEKLVQEVIATFGRLDIVVSNAGMNVFEGAAECSERIAKPYLEQSGNGVILLMTSNHAFCSIPGCFPYNVTKTAITGLVRSLTIEWGPKIRTVGVAPGFIDTAGNDTWFNSFPDAMAERQRTINLHPVKKIGTVEEVGALCVYLASPMAGFISGTTILMDGGRSALMQDS